MRSFARRFIGLFSCLMSNVSCLKFQPSKFPKLRFPRRFPSSFILLAAVLLLLGGCQITAPLRMPPASAPPLLFRGGAAADSTTRADSVSVADIQWADFFADSILVALVDTALQQNLDLRTTVQRIEVARADLRYARGALLPTVNGVAAAGLDRYGKYTQTASATTTPTFRPTLRARGAFPTPSRPTTSWACAAPGKLTCGASCATGAAPPTTACWPPSRACGPS